MSAVDITEEERRCLLEDMTDFLLNDTTSIDQISPLPRSDTVKLEITIDIDTTLDSKQIYICEDNSSGCVYSIKRGQSLEDAVAAAVRNYLQYETKI